MILEIDLLAEQIEELLERGCDLPVAEELLLGDLARALVQHAELEARDERVLVVAGDHRSGA